jgi:hypothetical protein
MDLEISNGERTELCFLLRELRMPQPFPSFPPPLLPPEMPSMTTIKVMRFRLRMDAEAASLPAAAIIIIIIIFLVA